MIRVTEYRNCYSMRIFNSTDYSTASHHRVLSNRIIDMHVNSDEKRDSFRVNHGRCRAADDAYHTIYIEMLVHHDQLRFRAICSISDEMLKSSVIRENFVFLGSLSFI